jgi:hypothetical protein
VAELRLEQAKAARAALDEKPKPAERHVFTTYASGEVYLRLRAWR